MSGEKIKNKKFPYSHFYITVHGMTKEPTGNITTVPSRMPIVFVFSHEWVFQEVRRNCGLPLKKIALH